MKKVIDYSITPVYFYRFVCNDPNISNMYVGSCINLTKRKSQHKYVCNNPNNKGYNLLVYKTIRDNGGWLNWRLLEIENKIVKDKTEATQCEQYWIEFYNAQMNMFKLNFNQREYREQYKEQNKEQINAYNREYYEQNKEQIKARHREYKEQNRERINAKQRERRQRKKQETQNVIEVV